MIQLFKPYVHPDAIAAATEVLQSGWIGLGPKVKEFENAFAKYVGAEYAVATNSATSALHLALEVSGVSDGDEVITTPMTFVSTNHAILYQRARPVFVDVDASTLNLDPYQIAKAPWAKAVVVVHYGGNPAKLDCLYELAESMGMVVIEDASHACGASFRGKRIGSFGLTCFSFHAVKNLPLGDGGMVTTNDADQYQRLLAMRWLGIDRSTFDRTGEGYQWEYTVKGLGYKYHMNDVIAAMGVKQLQHLDAWNDVRTKIVRRYREGLEEHVRFVDQTPGATSSNHLCVIRVPDRNAVVKKLEKAGIVTGVHYRPNHHYDLYRGARRLDLSRTEAAYKEIVSLPLHLQLSDSDVDYIVQAVREAVRA